MSRPKYMGALLARVGTFTALVPKANLIEVEILHDDDCGVFRSPSKPCTCEPEVGRVTDLTGGPS